MARFETIRIHCDDNDELSELLNQRRIIGNVVAILPTKVSSEYLTFDIIIDTLGMR